MLYSKLLNFSARFCLPLLLHCQSALAETISEPSVLVFSKTSGWRHSSIPFGIEAIKALGSKNGFSVVSSEDSNSFSENELTKYRAVIFLNTTHDVLNNYQQTAFERYIQAGGGFVGIHSAADTEYEWPWYGELVGAYFLNHPNHPNIRPATLDIVQHDHSATSHLPDHWDRVDEWYNYRDIYTNVQVIAYLDESSYDGGVHGSNHPVAWFHEYDGGRAFYTGGGHTNESYSEPDFLQHLLGGIQYAMGDGTPLDFSRSYSQVVPEENRFQKTVLVNDLNTPMELAIAPDGIVFFTELDGKVSVYDPASNTAGLIHKFTVARIGGTGLIGITLDPQFAINRFLYIYYSPFTEEEPIDFHLARFTVKQDNTLDLNSEKTLLTVPVQHNSGSHHGGSLAWDIDGNLYLSTGDSTTPRPSDGYAPLDERTGKEFFSQDAQRSAANTDDLKGKILRIHPEQDGSYTIPDGNLFPVDLAKTRPEIYVMGARNPYRIAVNPRSGTLYWGDIGPDAGHDSVARGPRGYDEFNQAKAAGNFGWPYFSADNQPYVDWDFATQTPGKHFAASAPINDSPNNTGLAELPPAQPAFIYYPYSGSEVFPELGEGGRSAMAGVFYQFDPDSNNPSKFPKYYDGGLFVFDWMRNWVRVLRFDENENYLRSEAFMTSNGDFRRPIDMAFSPTGELYVLEFGSVYGIDNEDARLVRINFNSGNRPPEVSARIVDETADAAAHAKSYLTSDYKHHSKPIRDISGPAPLSVKFGAKASDPDVDEISYEWDFADQSSPSTTQSPSHTFERPGNYRVKVTATDVHGAQSEDSVQVTVGNTRPEVQIQTSQNRTFFWDDQTLDYQLQVSDTEEGTVDPAKALITFVYRPRPIASEESDAKTLTAPTPLGESLIASSDCRACHTVDKSSIGPSYFDIARRYKDVRNSASTLADKVILGGGGNWPTEAVMPAHPQLDKKSVIEIINYIFSLTDHQMEPRAVPATGSISFDLHQADEQLGRYQIEAKYVDQAQGPASELIGYDTLNLRPHKLNTAFADLFEGFPRWHNNLGTGRHKGYVMLRQVDLTDIDSLTFEYTSWTNTSKIEIRIDSLAGPRIASVPLPASGDDPASVDFQLGKYPEGLHDLYFVVLKPEPPNDSFISFHSISFNR